ncbi:importin subunit alpha-1-like [Clytia hemisphaerica]|uniref:Importin subunit alpha n=1 Tax=Clytia hemisphaerica TaxID=252671 RepID=A0A7M5X1X0_9CNID
MSENRARSFKNRGKDIDDSRARRSTTSVQLRKAKKDQQILKKRNVASSMTSPLKENNQQQQTPLLPLEDITTVLLNTINPADDKIYQAVQSARRLLSREKNPPIDNVIKAGLVPKLVQLLQYDQNTLIQFEASWAVTNIASGSSEQTRHVVEAGAVDQFIRLLSSKHEQVCEQSVWALGNIAGDGPTFRDLVINKGVIEPLLTLITNTRPCQFLRNVTWTLSNLCRNKNPAPKLETIKPALPALCYLVNHSDDDIIADACWALSYLTDGPNEKISIIIETGIVPRLVQLLASSNVSIITPALRAIGNIVTGDDTQTQQVVDNGALPYLKHLFDHSKSQIVKEAAWAVSNIAAGNSNQIQAIIDAGLVPLIVEALDKGEFKVRRECVWVITNYTSGGTTEQVGFLLMNNVIPPLCSMLNVQDLKSVNVALDSINHILLNARRMDSTGDAVDKVTYMIEECGGLDLIEALQTSPQDNVQSTAISIMDTYFECEPLEDDANVAPTATKDAYQLSTAAAGSSHISL